MGLRNLVIPTALVKVSNSDGFTVRGLSPNDVLGLYYRHTGELGALYDRFTATAQKDTETDIAKLAANAIAEAPRIMAEIIALAADSDQTNDAEFDADVKQAMRFSTGVQAEALEKIGRLTFTSDMPPKKFFGLVTGMLGGATAMIGKTG